MTHETDISLGSDNYAATSQGLSLIVKATWLLR